ncbi:hypothetical protein ACFW04_012558 [Cataglyphis niger]
MMHSYLKAARIFISRHQIRETLNTIDPIRTANRGSRAIKKKTYKVATPNSLWHMDAHLKLWSFVIHGCIDGYSRLIIYLICETSIQAKPVINFFANAVNSYDLLSRVPTDHVYENLLAAILMSTIRGMHIGSHVTGQVLCDSIYTELYALEDQGLLDIENITHRFCVQYIFKIVTGRRFTIGVVRADSAIGIRAREGVKHSD